MEKTALLLSGMLIILGAIIVIILINPVITGSLISEEEKVTHAWTKAICDKDNLCQDYLIECNSQNPVKLTPLTGAVVQFSKEWQDPRTLEQKERLC